MSAAQSLLRPERWLDAWVRDHGGPTTRGDTVTVGKWHRVARVDPTWGLYYLCRNGTGSIWPSGGHRIEVSVDPFQLPPGEVCRGCLGRAADRPPPEPPPLADSDVERIAARVVELMEERVERAAEAT